MQDWERYMGLREEMRGVVRDFQSAARRLTCVFGGLAVLYSIVVWSVPSRLLPEVLFALLLVCCGLAAGFSLAQRALDTPLRRDRHHPFSQDIGAGSPPPARQEV